MKEKEIAQQLCAITISGSSFNESANRLADLLDEYYEDLLKKGNATPNQIRTLATSTVLADNMAALISYIYRLFNSLNSALSKEPELMKVLEKHITEEMKILSEATKQIKKQRPPTEKTPEAEEREIFKKEKLN